MKIVNTDNFGGDYPDEWVVAAQIPNKELAEVIAKALNDKFSGDYASRNYKVVDDDYVLKPGVEP